MPQRCRGKAVEVRDFRQRLDRANIEMSADIASLGSRLSSAVVIVAGDHSGYLDRNCRATLDDVPLNSVTRLDIQDRFGTFLAIRWPDGMAPQVDIQLLQDVMPAVLASISGDSEIWTARSTAGAEVTQGLPDGMSISNGLITGGPLDGQPLFQGLAG